MCFYYGGKIVRKLLIVVSLLLLFYSVSACSTKAINISFNVNGGNEIGDIVVENNNSSFDLPIPVKDGYTFDGWYVDEEFTNPFTSSLLLSSTSITVYAKWNEMLVEDNSGDYTYTLLSNNTYEITGYIGSNITLTIPSIHLGKAITSIGSFAFYNNTTLNNIIIPESIIDIGYSAFLNCTNLASITISEGVRNIGSNAFANCNSLTNITIPSTVVGIESDTFWNNNSLLSINVDDENQNYSSENGVLFNKTKTRLIAYPIGKEDNNYLIPSTVTEIAQNAFANSISLLSISIPSNVTNIEPAAFFNVSNLTNIVVAEENQFYASEDGILFNKQKTILIFYPKGKTANTYEIPASITSIGPNAFENCYNLTSITIPYSVTGIDSLTFWNNTNLTNIIVDDGNQNYSSKDGVLFNKQQTVLIIYPSGRLDTSYLIPLSVTSIGSNAFANSLNLTNILISSNVTTIGDIAFYNCKSLTSITIPLSVISVGSYLFEYCDNLIIYVEATSKPSGWDSAWNSHNLSVIWGYES